MSCILMREPTGKLNKVANIDKIVKAKLKAGWKMADSAEDLAEAEDNEERELEARLAVIKAKKEGNSDTVEVAPPSTIKEPLGDDSGSIDATESNIPAPPLESFEMVTIKEAVEKSSLTEPQVRGRMKKPEVLSEKINGVWHVSLTDLKKTVGK